MRKFTTGRMPKTSNIQSDDNMSDKLFKKEDVHLELPQLAYWDKEITEFANAKVAPLLEEFKNKEDKLTAALDYAEKMINRRIWTDEEQPSDYNQGQHEFAVALKTALRNKLAGYTKE